MTFSLGFRAPLLSDVLSDLAVELSLRVGSTLSGSGSDRSHEADEIDPSFIAHGKRQLLTLLDNDPLIADWLAVYDLRLSIQIWWKCLVSSGALRHGAPLCNGEPMLEVSSRDVENTTSPA